MRNNLYFCIRKAKGGEVSLPFGSQTSISNFILTFQIFNEIESFISSLAFHFSLAMVSGLNLCFCITKIQKYFEIYNKNQDCFCEVFIFSGEQLTLFSRWLCEERRCA